MLVKQIIFTFSLLFITQISIAQTFELIRGTLGQGDFLEDVIETPEGNFLAVGRVAGDQLFYGLFDNTGDTLWTNNDFTGNNLIKAFVVENGYYLFGTRNDGGFMINIDAAGNVIETKSYTFDYSANLMDVDKFPDGTYALIFQYTDNDLEYVDPEGELVLTDMTADILSTQILNLNDTCGIGYKNIVATNTGEIVLHYEYGCSTPSEPNEGTVFCKFNMDYTVAWEVSTLPTWTYHPKNSIVEDEYGDFYFAYGSVEPWQIDGYVLGSLGKISADGILLWNNVFPINSALGNADCDIQSIATTAEGNLVVCGNINGNYQSGQGGDAFLSLLTNEGEVIWSKYYLGYDNSTANDFFSSVRQTSNGGFILSGWAGIGEWAQPNDYQQYLVLADDTGCLDTYTVGGYVWRDIDANCEENIEDEAFLGINVTAKRGSETIAVETDENGYYQMELPIGEFVLSLEVPLNVDICENNKEIDAAFFQAIEDVNFLIDFSTSVNEISVNNLNATIYPNPAQNEVELHINNENSDFQFSLIDVTGRVIWSQEIKNRTTLIDLSEVEKGIYFWELQDEVGNEQNGKIFINQ